MRTADVRAAFEAHLDSRGLTVAGLDAATAVDAMLEWYAAARVADVQEDGGDLLLFQWGTYGWGGEPPSFQYDLTRQLVAPDAGGDEGIYQLSLTVHYAPAAESAAAGDGEQWCEHPRDVAAFRQFVEAQEATAYARRTPVQRVTLAFGGV